MFQLNRETFTERVVCHAWNSSFQIVDKRPNVAIELLRWQQQITKVANYQVDLDTLEVLDDAPVFSPESVHPEARTTRSEPTRDDVRKHRLSHWQNRSQCRHRVKGRARNGTPWKVNEPRMNVQLLLLITAL